MDLPTLLPELRVANDESESEASDSGRAEIQDQSTSRYIVNEQIVLDDDNRQEGHDVILNENKEVLRIADDDSKENTSEEQSEESSEEEISEFEQQAPLLNTRRMISYPTEKPVDMVTLPGDIADQKLGIKISYFNSQHTQVYVRSKI